MKSELLNALVSDDGSRVDRRIFSDEDVYRREQETVFAESWLFVGHESQVSQAGDFVLSRMGEESVIVARSREGQVHVSLNSCRHRGLPVCRADKGRANTFSCPYHGWTYSCDGALTGMPGQESYYPDIIKTDWGLVQARVELYKGLIFATFSETQVGLEQYLGDSRFYLDTLVDRRGQGTEVIGVQKWRVKTNWKMPTENMVGDVYHAGFSHRSVFDMHPDAKQAYAEIESSLNVAIEGGHGLTARYFTEGTPIQDRVPCEQQLLMLSADVLAYYEQHDQQTKKYMGELRTRIKPATSAVFPNLHLLSTTYCIRVGHPVSADETEIWNWIIVEKDMPESVRDAIKQNYYFLFGPEGMLEQDDDENWEQVTQGSHGVQASRHPFHLSMGMKGQSEVEDQCVELPGLVATTRSEHPQRNFYRHWHQVLTSQYGGGQE
ncbi:MAG: aromatic ring-hydroxylating dioxygenase subunit alpha [Cellvibrionaceae bacterium]|nr:aromatic ring-hydroxylating dioxygenase subunit alpha [Cellvibrionaceae bacterium]|tara:strand:+ start:159 stop:1466 length:1308 start_codon:yes stop_codon:yes gene_type:complete